MAEQHRKRVENTEETPSAASAKPEVVDEFESRLVSVKFCTKVVKGGKNRSYGAMVVVGDKAGKVGIGYGKANENADAIRKGTEQARKHLFTVPMNGTTITHRVEMSFGGAKVMIRPASPGTGVIAGGGMRHVLELAGIKDVLAKSMGANNAENVVKATFKALQSLRTRAEILAKRDREAL